MLTALKTERSDTIEVFFHSYMVSLHSHRRFLVQVAEVFRRTMPGLAQSWPRRVTQFSFSISVLHTTTVAIGNISFWINTWADLQNSGFSHWHLSFLNPHCINIARNRYTSLHLHCFNSTSCRSILWYFTWVRRWHMRLSRSVCESTWCHLKNTSSFSWMQTINTYSQSHAPNDFTYPCGGHGALCQPDQLLLHPHWPDPE